MIKRKIVLTSCYSLLFLFATIYSTLSVEAATRRNDSLAVNNVYSINPFAAADGTFLNGFRWKIAITVPQNEPIVSLKFDDLTSDDLSISVAKNLRFYSEQSKNANDIEKSIIVNRKNVYEGRLLIDQSLDLDEDLDGVQIEVIVETSLPSSSKPGKYSLLYGIKSFDDISPVITLIGDAYITHERGTPYSDAGATVTDNQYDRINATADFGVFNKDIVGDYKIKYTATDSAGNVAREVERSVRIIDTTPPEISVPYFDNVIVPTNKDVLIEAFVDEGILNASSHNFTNNGEFLFTAVDNSGNSSEYLVEVDNIDKNPPTITLVGLPNIIIERNTNFDDDGASAIDQEGRLNEITSDRDTVLSTDKVGTYVITYTATDSAGNTASVTRSIEVVDTKGPQVSLTYSDTAFTKDNVTVTASIVDEVGTLNETTHQFLENGTFEFIAIDEYNNETRQLVTVGNIDRTPPTLKLKNEGIEVLVIGDTLPLDLCSVLDNLDSNPLMTDDSESSINVNEEGLYTITFNAADAAMNEAIPLTKEVKVVAPPSSPI